jgi:hypothetical protein
MNSADCPSAHEVVSLLIKSDGQKICIIFQLENVYSLPNFHKVGDMIQHIDALLGPKMLGIHR